MPRPLLPMPHGYFSHARGCSRCHACCLLHAISHPLPLLPYYITSHSLTSFVPLPLQELVLDRTAVGDAGVLHAARGLPLLRTLCITNYTHNRRAMLWGAVIVLCYASRCAS